MEYLQKLLESYLPQEHLHYYMLAIQVLVLALVSVVAFFVIRKVLYKSVQLFVAKSKNKWDDVLLQYGFFSHLVHLIPALIIYFGGEIIFKEGTTLAILTINAAIIYMWIAIVNSVKSFLAAANLIYNQESTRAKSRPIKGYTQVIMIVAYIVAAIYIISTLMGYDSPGRILTGLGAMATVLLFIFKDTILGLVSSVQLTGNDMVRIGDWISMPSHKADGTVLEISLTTVKVQNWDKTISTIPTYALVAESFANWRGMEESGGRRIKRNINIDMNSVHFCSKELIEKSKEIEYLEAYLATSEQELSSWNKDHKTKSSVVNGRRLTNLGIFRKYLEGYLRNHPQVSNDMTFLVRQLQPTEKGIPMEIYVFSTEQDWAYYEAIQADIFDHILAVIPEFELRVFQNPTGSDLKAFTKQ